jgi:hypothetical protein
MPKIVCIGWGSLVSAPGSLRCIGGWNVDGPELPVEFSRTSMDGRLTLVLTADTTPVPTLWSEVDYGSPDEARAALAARENSNVRWVGCWPGPVPDHALGREQIAAWAEGRGIDAVVWTALPPKFAGRNGLAPDSASAATAYLKSLDGDTLANALRYIKEAPAQVRTAYRVAFEQVFESARSERVTPSAP